MERRAIQDVRLLSSRGCTSPPSGVCPSPSLTRLPSCFLHPSPRLRLPAANMFEDVDPAAVMDKRTNEESGHTEWLIKFEDEEEVRPPALHCDNHHFYGGE